MGEQISENNTIDERDYEGDLSIYNDADILKRRRRRKIVASLIIALLLSMSVTSFTKGLGYTKGSLLESSSSTSEESANYGNDGKEKSSRLDDEKSPEQSSPKQPIPQQVNETNPNGGNDSISTKNKKNQNEAGTESLNHDIDTTSSKGEDEEISVEEDLYDDYNCIGDRVQHEVKLNRGDYICARNGLYMLGLNKNGHFIYRNNTDSRVKTFTNEGEQGDQLELTRDATFIIYKETEEENDEENIVWVRECTEEVDYSSRCLPDYDCPYLHIHKGGVVVMNWIDMSTGWNEVNIKKIFDLKWNKK